MLNKNRFEDIYKLVDQLRNSYPTLEHLSLLGNEACPYRITADAQASSDSTDLNAFAENRLEEKYQRYRYFLIFRIPTLKFLDAKEVNQTERRFAMQLGDLDYAIKEAKQSRLANAHDDKNSDHNSVYTPLPKDTSKNKRISVGKVAQKYSGEGSQGNKFVRDSDL